ncbi:MAG: hypothetical protein B7X06_03455 [Verrucomicrobia bacterium 21-51-4]|nr:MAG: hypothetical protein B7X06_03455 [Verrucomicrobia bacterium 21-51-4]HQU08891.1 DUF4870 domain-containing protein [Opitutales bacterium]
MESNDKPNSCGCSCACNCSTNENLTRDEKLWGMLVHLSSLVQLLFIPLTHLICPMIIWLIKKDGSSWIDKQGKEAVNFNLSILIYGLIAWATVFFGIGVFLLPVVAIFWLVCTIIASIKASEGKCFCYPLSIRFLK